MTAARKDQPRPELTGAVLLLAWDRVLADLPAGDPNGARAAATAKSELLRLGLIDEIGNPTKEGRRQLGLI